VSKATCYQAAATWVAATQDNRRGVRGAPPRCARISASGDRAAVPVGSVGESQAWPIMRRADEPGRVNLLYDRTGNFVRKIYDRRLTGPAVLDTASHFADAKRFLASWQVVRDEALAIARDIGHVPRFHELMPSQTDISAQDGRDWRMFVLKAYGAPIAKNLERCPRLAELVQSSPDVLSAAFSFLAPGKYVPRHRGPFRGVIRFHLGLSGPLATDGKPASVLKIEDIEHRLEDGSGLLWDDTFPHEAWNRGDRVRIALLLDIRRHGMPFDMSVLSRFVIAIARTAVTLRGVP